MAETPAAMYGIATSMTILALVAIALRFYARYIKKTGYSWDDWMILPAMVCIGSLSPVIRVPDFD